MKQYKLSEEEARKHVSRRMLNRIPVIIISVGLGLLLPMIRGVNIFHNKSVLFIILLLVILSVIIGLFVSFKIGVKGALNTYYTLSEYEVKVVSPLRTVCINIDAISSCRSYRKGLVIKEGFKAILMPIELNDYDEIVNILSKRIF